LSLLNKLLQYNADRLNVLMSVAIVNNTETDKLNERIANVFSKNVCQKTITIIFKKVDG